MCRRLTRAGCPVHAFDLEPTKLAEAVAAGAAADIFLTSLPRPDHVQAVIVHGVALEALHPGATWVDLSTNRVGVVSELANRAPQGVRVVDSPVTGAVDGARTGWLTLFVGGEPAVVEIVTPILSELGTVIACARLGSGKRGKAGHQPALVHRRGRDR